MAFTQGLDAAKAQAWAVVLQQELYNSVVGLNIADTKFEGTFKNGVKTVHFPRIKATSGFDMASPSATFTPSTLQSEDETMTLDVHKGWAVDFATADISQMKANPTNQIIKQLKQYYKEEWEKEIFRKAIAGAGIATGGATGLTIANGETLYDTILDGDQKLTENNAPMEDRFIVISPADHKLLKKYLASRGTSLGDKVLQNGYAGEVDGVRVYVSNMLPKVGSVRNLIMGQGKPVCFASDIHPDIVRVGQEMKANSFVDTIKSQSRFGAKVFAADAVRLVNIAIKV
jgi:hypothetical protein|nr:MAG TPA: capsid protein [Caudoviricetes sp.]